METYNAAHFVSGMELFWAQEQKPIKTVTMGNEGGKAVMHQPMDPLSSELPGLLVKLLHCHILDIFSLNLQPLMCS
jgi:hypothetical protein